MSGAHLPGLAILDALRPGTGWRVDRALLSTYSADPAVLAAILLALVARDDDGGSGTKAALARALVELRGRVAFVVQRGRIAAPIAGGLAVGMLDRYVREVPWPEGRGEDEDEDRAGETPRAGLPGRSWHAKLAVIRMLAEDGATPRWRLWLGSRNFTRDLSWDIGLCLEGEPAGRGQEVPGVAELMRRLAATADETKAWAPLLKEAGALRWDVPRGLRIARLDLLLPEDAGRSMPAAPPGLTSVFAASPFLDGRSVARLGAWGDAVTSRRLLSTRKALAGIASQAARPLSGYAELLALPAPAFQDPVAAAGETAEADTEGRGLHAKFVWAEHSGGATLWLGSANLTARGWTRNAEVVAEVAIERRGGAAAATALIDGIEAFRRLGEEVAPQDLVAPDAEDPETERLEAARREVAARFDARQRPQRDGTVHVECIATPPHPADPDVSLSLRRLVGLAVPWPRNAPRAVLPGVDEGAQSDLLVLTVALGARELSWTQVAPFDPPLGHRRDARDAAALGAWLGARGLLATLHDLLSGEGDSDASGPWDAPDAQDGVRGAARPAQPAERDAPSVEQALRVWQRDPARLAMVDKVLRSPLPAKGTGDAQEEAARRQLEAFRRSWVVIRQVLGTAHAD
jgi:hypothetical protein